MTRDPFRGSEPFNLRYWWWGFLGCLEYALNKPESLYNAWCRFRGHPNGIRYYALADEPDYTCIDCGEYLN